MLAQFVPSFGDGKAQNNPAPSFAPHIESDRYGLGLLPLYLVIAILAFASPTLAESRPLVYGNNRFQVLSANLIRLEYSPKKLFVDRPSVAVQNRSWQNAQFSVRQSHGWIEISTAILQLRYRVGSGAFSAGNLFISWSDQHGQHRWKPGDKDDANLGGVPGDIALRTVPGTEPGPLSRTGYFLLDDSHTAVWNSAGDWVESRADQNEQDWYFFAYGSDFKGLLGELSHLLGPIPMVPRYIFGTWFGSRAGYSSDEWKRIIGRFREEHIPLDIVTLDSDSTAKVIWAGRDWDLEQMPDPPGFFKYAQTQGVKVVVNEHYGALTPENCSNFERIRTAMGLPAGTKEIRHDLANKKYAELYMDILNRPALEQGMAFWWQDGNASANMPGLDPTLWTRHVEYTGAEKITGKRAFVFERLDVPYQRTNATPAWGGHRYGGFFTGDLAAHWPTLNLLVPFNVQAGNMLVPYVINDNPGFTPQVVNTELYERAIEFHALSPIFWWHGIWGLRTPWEYGSQALDIARRFLQLRYALIPYLYTYSRIAHETGEPIVRGTYLEYPDQEASYEFRQQYLLGNEMLVAPISEAGFGERVTKEIYLPAGEDWFDWFSGRIYKGGKVISYECPLDRSPIFVKAGSILPLAPPMDYSDQHRLDPLTIEVFAGRPASFRMYEDDGTSLNYRNGEYSWTEFTYAPSSNSAQHTINIEPAQGHFEGQLDSRSYKIRVHGLSKPAAVYVDSRLVAQDAGLSGGWTWDDQNRVTSISIPAVSVHRRLNIRLEGSGSFASSETLQRLITFREGVRDVELAEKLKWGVLLKGEDIKKEPRVLRETEQVEQQLNDLIDSVGVGKPDDGHADFHSWIAQISQAFVQSPFESNRTIPEIDPDAIKSTHAIETATFSPEEVNAMTARLLGCRLAAKVSSELSPIVTVRADCDFHTMNPSQVTYSISLPQSDTPGWAVISRNPDEHGFMNFHIQGPSPTPAGVHMIRLKAMIKFDAGQTEVSRTVKWRSPGDTGL
jgi:alpha-glucosidase (family GH31 glycosyl hydrolase)